MPDGSPSLEPQVFFDELVDSVQQAALDVGTQEWRFEIAGIRVTVHLAGHALEPLITCALLHLRSQFIGSADLTVHVVNGASVRINRPQIPWEHYGDLFSDSYGTQGEIEGFNTERFGLIHSQWFGQIHMLDRQRAVGVIWYDDAEAQPYWEKTIPLRAILHLWTLGLPLQLTHSAAVGLAEGGVLIAGHSGAGKSTATLACIANDSGDPKLLFAGDDYVALRLDSDPTIFSLYQLAKLENDNLSRFPELRPFMINPNRQEGEKALISLLEAYPDAITSGFPLRAILVPHVTGQRDSRIVAGSRGEALQALAPTTLFQLIGSKRVAFEKLQTLVRRFPVYKLEAGTDLSQIPQVVKSFLRRELSL